MMTKSKIYQYNLYIMRKFLINNRLTLDSIININKAEQVIEKAEKMKNSMSKNKKTRRSKKENWDDKRR